MKVSHSQLQKFRKCQQAWAYEYAQGIKPNYSDSMPMIAGKMFHAGVEKILLTKSVPDAAIVVQDISLEYINAGYNMDDMIAATHEVERVLRYHAERLLAIDPLIFDGKVFVEYEIDVPFTLGAGMRGYVDCVYYDPLRGHNVLADWKLRTRMADINDAVIDDQLHLYAALLNRFVLQEHPILSIEMWQFRKATPKPAKINKNGMPSTAAQITTWDVWRDTLPYGMELDLDAWQEKLSGKLKEPEYFLHIASSPVTPESMDFSLSNAIQTTNDIMDKAATGNYTKQLSSYACAGCAYKEICQAMRYGEDPAFLIAEKFALDNDTE